MTRRTLPQPSPFLGAAAGRRPSTRLALALLGALTLGACGGGAPEPPKSGALETTYYDPATRSLKQSEGEVRFGRKVGPWKWWHPTQTIAKQGTFDEQGRETGDWIEFHANQVESSRLTYVEGLAQGPALEWHQNGTKRTVGTLDKGQRTGVWETFYENGALESRATYVADKLEGEAVGWHPNGTEKERARFRAGVMVGEAEGYSPNGQLVARKVMDDQGRTIGDSVEFYEDGKPKAVKPYDAEGREHGLEVTYHPSGNVATLRTFEVGKLVGMSRAWLDDGRLHYEGAYVDGKREGLWRSYHLDGTRQGVVKYVADKLWGISWNWYPGGQVHMIQAFEDNVPRGLFQQWYPNGRRKLYSERDGDRIVGVNFEWTDEGALAEEVSGRYVDNAPVRPMSAEDLALAEELAADTSSRLTPGEGPAYEDLMPALLALEAQPPPLPILPKSTHANDSDR